MSDQTQAKQTKAKGTSKTEAIIGAASNKYVTVTKALKSAVDEALKMTDLMGENALRIADQEEKLSNLNTEYNNKRTQNRIDLDLAYKADQKEFADKYLQENGLIAVEKEEYDDMISEISDLKQNFEAKVKAEVGREKAIAENRLENEKRLFEAQYQAKEAQNLARISNLESSLAFANKQADTWEKQLNAERQASIERSKSQSATVNVATPTK